jgi:hypothetical protein
MAGTYPTEGRFGYLSDDNKALLVGTGANSTPNEYPEKSAIATMISTALASWSGGGGGNGEYLITTPTVSGNTSAQAGASVTLIAASSAYLWGGSAGITYEWTVGSTVTTGATLALTASATVGGTVTAKCRALGTGGTTSASVTTTVTTSANNPPVVTGVTTTLPASVTRTSAYNITISGGSDPDGGAVSYALSNPVGCTLSATATTGAVTVTVSSTATAVSFDVKTVDAQGLQSTTAITISRSGASVGQPSGTTGALPAGTSTQVIPAGISSITVISNGGVGPITNTATVPAGFGSSPSVNPLIYNPATPVFTTFDGYGCKWTYTYTGSTTLGVNNYSGVDCHGATMAPTMQFAIGAGSATTVSDGGTTLVTSPGAAAGVRTYPAPITQVIALDPSISHALTIVNNGSCTINW